MNGITKRTLCVALVVVSLASAAKAQDGATLVFSRGGWDVGAVSETQYGQGLSVQLEAIQRDTIAGEPKIYIRARFCNSGYQPWIGGQRLSERNLQITHASLRVPANECRSWTEWMPRNVQSIFVYLRRASS